MCVDHLRLVCSMRKFFILVIALQMVCWTYAQECHDIVVVDYAVAFAKSKVGINVSNKISTILRDLKNRFAALEDKLRAAASKKICNPRSSNVVFDKNIDFDATVYINSSEKDKHLMLYTLAQKKSNEVSDLAAEAEKNLRAFIKRTIKKVAAEIKVKIVLDKSAIVYSDSSVVDITDKVIKQADIDMGNFKYPKGM